MVLNLFFLVSPLLFGFPVIFAALFLVYDGKLRLLLLLLLGVFSFFVAGSYVFVLQR